MILILSLKSVVREKNSDLRQHLKNLRCYSRCGATRVWYVPLPPEITREKGQRGEIYKEYHTSVCSTYFYLGF